MVLPLVILMVLSAAFAYTVGGKGDYFLSYLTKWTRSDMRVSHEILAGNHTYRLLEMVSIGVAFAGVGLAVVLYWFMPALVNAISRAPVMRTLHAALLNKWWVDELYDLVVVRPLGFASRMLFKVVDRGLVDAAVNGTGVFVVSNGEIIRRMHTGKVGYYASVMLFGTVCSIVFWLLL